MLVPAGGLSKLSARISADTMMTICEFSYTQPQHKAGHITNSSVSVQGVTCDSS